jgi:hypothetical protein
MSVLLTGKDPLREDIIRENWKRFCRELINE